MACSLFALAGYKSKVHLYLLTPRKKTNEILSSVEEEKSHAKKIIHFFSNNKLFVRISFTEIFWHKV